MLQRARKLVTKCLDLIADATHKDPLPLVKEAIKLASPDVKIVNHRKSAKVVIVPYALNERQRVRQAMLWILDACQKRNEVGLPGKMARELMDLVNGRSKVLDRKEQVHNQAIVNRANARTR